MWEPHYIDAILIPTNYSLVMFETETFAFWIAGLENWKFNTLNWEKYIYIIQIFAA